MEDQKKSRIKVLPVDDHPVVLEGIRACLRCCDQFEIVGVARSGEEAMGLAERLSPDVFLMDVRMAGIDGLEAARRLRTICPCAKVLIFAEPEPSEFVTEVLQSGARGWIQKTAPIHELISGIERVHRGEAVFSPEIAQKFFDTLVSNGGLAPKAVAQRISPRERQVLHLLVDGAPNRSIAESLNISIRTVEKHRQRMMRKFDLHKATELVRFAITNGIVNLSLL